MTLDVARALRSSPDSMRRRRFRHDQHGFTLVEMMIVVGIIGVMAALGAPLFNGFFADLRLKAAARDAADALRLARIEAIRTNTPHLVFFSTGPADPGGTPLPVDPATTGPVPIVIVQDVGNNCMLDAADPQRVVLAKPGLSWGTTVSGANSVATDNGAADHSSGSSFRTQAGAGTNWVRFGRDGVPEVFDAACNAGGLGSGAGALYLTNGRRDYAVVMSALGAVRVHNWVEGVNDWSN